MSDWNHEIAGSGAQAVVLSLVENLELENQALLQGDASILEAVDHGDRLDDMRGRLSDAAASGSTVVERYQIDDVNLVLLVPFGRQESLSLGLDSTGTVVTEVYDAAGNVQIAIVGAVRPRCSSCARSPAGVGSTSPCCRPAPIFDAAQAVISDASLDVGYHPRGCAGPRRTARG